MPHNLAALALAVPIAAATLTMSALAVLEQRWPETAKARQPANLAEAAASGHAADAIRRLRLGDNPHRIYTVREHIISSEITRATTAEAALWSRRIELVRLLDEEGAIPGGEDRRALACLALDLQLPEIADYLTGGQGARCVPQQAFDRLRTRTASGGAP